MSLLGWKCSWGSVVNKQLATVHFSHLCVARLKVVSALVGAVVLLAFSTLAFAFSPGADGNFDYDLSGGQMPVPIDSTFKLTKGESRVVNGAFFYSIPIHLPPTINNIAPGLSFTYSSENPTDSHFGVGWELKGIGAITRCQATFATEGVQAQKPNPRYSKGDRLCFNGQKLILIDDPKDASDNTYWAANAEYKTEIDSFSKIVANNDHTQFTVYLKNGLIQTYGDSNGQNSTYYRPGFSSGDISRWSLAETEDRYGNSYKVYYNYDLNDFEQTIRKIEIDPNVIVDFDYIEKSEPRFGYDKGHKYVKRKIISQITVSKVDLASQAHIANVRKYKITYPAEALSGGKTSTSKLESITQCGFTGEMGQDVEQCGLPLSFSWPSDPSGYSGPFSVSSGNGGAEHPGGYYRDVDGDGYSDHIEEGALTLRSPEGDTFFDLGGEGNHLTPLKFKDGIGLIKVETAEHYGENGAYVDVDVYLLRKKRGQSEFTSTFLQTGNSNRAPQPLVTDFNNDGLEDVCVFDECYLQSSATGELDLDNYWDPAWRGGEFVSLDVNSDGLMDRVRAASVVSGSTGQISGEIVSDLGTGHGFDNNLDSDFPGWSAEYLKGQMGGQILSSEYPREPGISSGSAKTLVDLNGDGLRDVVYTNKSKKLSYRLNTGYGLTDEVETSYTTGYGVGHAKDFNGDGLGDYLHTWGDNSYGYVYIYITSIENGAIVFTRRPVTGVEGVSSDGTCSFQSFPDSCKALADRAVTEEKLMSIGDARNEGVHLFTVSKKVYKIGGMPNSRNRLSSIVDGVGHQINVRYELLKRFGSGGHTGIYGISDLYEPQETVFPYLPAPRSKSVVQYVETSNGIGGFDRRFYLYEGARVSATGRGFLGFNKIRAVKYNKDIALNGERVPLLEDRVHTEYHQEFPYTGRIKSVQMLDEHRSPLSHRFSFYKVHPENPDFVYEERRFEEFFESMKEEYPQAPPLPTGNREQSFTYDRFGNLTYSHLIQGNPKSNIPSPDPEVEYPVHHTIINNSYDNNETDHLLGFLNYTRTDTYFEDGSDQRSRCQTFQAEPGTLDVSLSFSNCDWNPVNGAVALQHVYVRNSKGVVTQVQSTGTDPDSNYPTRTTTYQDFEYDIYPRGVYNSLGDVTTLEYDHRHSEVSKTIDANGFESGVYFDAWGREVGSYDSTTGNKSSTGIQICDSQTCPVEAKYFARSLTANDSVPNKLAGPVEEVFYDLLGREVRRQSHSLGGIVKVDTEYDEEGNVYRKSDPYTGSSADYWTTFTYDERRRVKTESSSRFEREVKYASSSGIEGLRKTEIITTSGPNGDKTQTTVTYQNALGQVRQVLDNMSNKVDYTYDSQGNLHTTTVNDNPDTTVTIVYDEVGNKVQVDDPDAGLIDFEYNGFGELRYQFWAKGTTDEKSMEFIYDGLGRKELRVDTFPNGDQERFRWDWDYPFVGVLTAAYREADQYGQYYTYNNKGQVESVGPWETSGSPRFDYQYDDFGRVSQITYPMGHLSVERKYGIFGEHVRTVNTQNQQPIWELGNIADSQGNLTHQRYGNGVVTQYTYHPTYGTMQKVEAGKNGLATVQSLSYSFDGRGNLYEREMERITPTSYAHQSESFDYDGLYRLISDGGDASSSPCGQNYCYDDLGNLTYKSGVGNLSYNQVNGAGVHAITNGAGRSYHYDAYGNMTLRDSDRVDYDVFNKPIMMRSTHFVYGADHELLRQTSYDTQVDTFYVNGLYGEKFEALVSANGTETYRNYVDGVMLFESNQWFSSPTTSYLHYDHLGSVDAITDANGNVKDFLSFNAWGERRQEDWNSGDPTMGVSFFYDTQLGYTGHEMLDQFGLVHMGGRVYDPLVSRFVSADLLVPEPLNSQSYNRYSYVYNNPLSYTDPTGYVPDKYDSSDPCGGSANCSVVYAGPWQTESLWEAERFRQQISDFRQNLAATQGRWQGGFGVAYSHDLYNAKMLYPFNHERQVDHVLDLSWMYVEGGTLVIGSWVGSGKLAVSVYPLTKGGLRKISATLGRALSSVAGRVGAKGAFKIAQEGGRHAGQLKQFLKQDATQLGRSIRKFDKNIAKHEKWITDPKSKIPEWNTFSAERQANTIHHWQQDIARARELQSIAKEVAKQKGF